MKKKMKKYKIVTLIMLIVISFFFLNQNVYAERPTACAEDLNDACYAELFGMYYDLDLEDGKDELTLYVTHKYKDAEGNDVVFKILEVNGKKIKKKNGKSYKVSYGNPVTIKMNLKSSGNVVVLRTTKDVKVVTLDGKHKKTGKITAVFSLTQSAEMSGQAEDLSGEGSLDGLLTLSVGTTEINCDGVTVDKSSYEKKASGIFNYTTFRDRFCYAKKAAQGSSNYLGNISQLSLEGQTFADNKCKVDARKVTLKYGQENWEKQYYQNVNFYYAEHTYPKTGLGHYEYNYSLVEPKKSKELSCDLTCQESVTVAYGPPVATKAGLCFEYRVKVTSRVHCYVSNPPAPPKHPTGYCEPGPTCYHSGVKYKQGGPVEEFEKCVRECDGGKYTPKCSNTCYEKIYGKTLETYEVNKTAKESEKENTLSSCISSSSYHGCYYRNSLKGSIKWSGQKGHFGRGGVGVYAPGRWYWHHNWGIAGHSYYVPLNDGFYRADQGNGTYCHDSCSWGGCAWNKYLNPGQDDIDWVRNRDVYNEAIRKCQAEATCNTTTTTFEISASYNRATDENGSTEKVVVHFPYTNKNDIKIKNDIESGGPQNKDVLETCDKSPRQDTSGNANTTIFEHGWCYGESCPTDRIGYFTAWTFPGSWINRKTGEVSYDRKYAGDEAWRTKEDKFCVPKDALSVNAYWYQWYFHYVEKTETSEYDNICLTNKTKEIMSKKYSEYSKTPTEYNIFARTKKFGYFKWNFNISCFYALDRGDNSDPHAPTTVINESTYEKCQPTEYRIRTVTTNDLFPDGTNSSGSSVARARGYNWKDDAALTAQGLPQSYKTLPSQTLIAVQSAGNKIYHNPGGDLTKNEYVDYAFSLTPHDLNAIVDYNAKLKSYDVFCGPLVNNKEEFSNISVYRSNLFRSETSVNDQSIAACQNAGVGAIKVDTSKGDKLGTVGVNNQ